MENIFNIQAESRSETGKKISKQLRKNGKIPAIIYGGNQEAIAVSVELSEIKTVMRSEARENSILRIKHEKDAQLDAMIKQVQYDYLSNSIIHLDFIRIDLSKPVEVNVPIILEGEPIGVKMEDGLLDFVSREIHLRCLPTKIPRQITINIADLHAGHSIRVEDLPKSEEYQFTSNLNTVICAVTSKAKEEDVAVPEAEVATTPTEGEAPPAPESEKKEE